MGFKDMTVMFIR